jgi:uncharacterized protein involved in cysteine biosynthesis
MPFEAARLIFGHGTLLRLALLPILLTLMVTIAALWVGFHWGQSWLGHVWSAPVVCHDCTWYHWLWTRLGAAAWYLTWLSGTLAFSSVAGLLTSRIATFALMDALAKQVLDYLRVTGSNPFAAQSMLVQLLRAVKRGLVLIAGYLLLGLLSLIPGAAMITTPLGLVWTVLWLHVDNCTYPLQWLGPARLADVRLIAQQNPAMTAGFLASTCAIQLIPFVGFAATPVAVGGACLYVAANHHVTSTTLSAPALAA